MKTATRKPAPTPERLGRQIVTFEVRLTRDDVLSLRAWLNLWLEKHPTYTDGVLKTLLDQTPTL